jgi:hypothetical protein
MALLLSVSLLACNHPQLIQEQIYKPDEYKKIYEAKEKFVLAAVAAAVSEKEMGENILIDYQNRRLGSDYVVKDGWRTRTNARVKQLNWKECELTLYITTEKQSKEGWKMVRLLDKEQYEKVFSLIELKIYEEMSRAR